MCTPSLTNRLILSLTDFGNRPFGDAEVAFCMRKSARAENVKYNINIRRMARVSNILPA